MTIIRREMCSPQALPKEFRSIPSEVLTAEGETNSRRKKVTEVPIDFSYLALSLLSNESHACVNQVTLSTSKEDIYSRQRLSARQTLCR
jgi:hypothetical protein